MGDALGSETARMYAETDKESVGPLDGQIDRDIPRCHQVRLGLAGLYAVGYLCPDTKNGRLMTVSLCLRVVQ